MKPIYRFPGLPFPVISPCPKPRRFVDRNRVDVLHCNGYPSSSRSVESKTRQRVKCFAQNSCNSIEYCRVNLMMISYTSSVSAAYLDQTLTLSIWVISEVSCPICNRETAGSCVYQPKLCEAALQAILHVLTLQ
jgi:hypothetical protein